MERVTVKRERLVFIGTCLVTSDRDAGGRAGGATMLRLLHPFKLQSSKLILKLICNAAAAFKFTVQVQVQQVCPGRPALDFDL